MNDQNLIEAVGDEINDIVLCSGSITNESFNNAVLRIISLADVLHGGTVAPALAYVAATRARKKLHYIIT